MTDLDVMLAGVDAEVRPTGRGDDRFTALHQKVKAAGLLDPQPGYYALKILSGLLLLAAGWTLFVLVGDSWWQVAVAALLAFGYTQLGFLGHDIGHRQIARSRARQDLLGWSEGVLMGFSYGWWVRHHNHHHSYPNHLARDTGISRARYIFTPEQGWSRKGPWKKFVVRHQHILFYPLLCTEGLALRIASVVAIKRGKLRKAGVEAAVLAVHLTFYLGVVFVVLPPAKAIIFVLVHQGLFGLYIGWAFAPNHNGMPMQGADDEWDWLTRQVVTCRNLGSSRLTEFFYGGVNNHIEHHLFPMMARNNLRRARPLVKQFCQDHDVVYCEITATQSVLAIIGHLRTTTKAFQAQVRAAAVNS
jgi:fatty acid desaturase